MLSTMSDLNLYLEPGEDSESASQRYALRVLPCTVGRGSSCGLQLDFDRISREHARFEKLDNRLLVTDLNSTNGTFVNHQRIEEPTLVRVGDTIHFANHEFTLQYRQPSGATLPHPQTPERRASGDTIVGFTALPTGFPVQAPEFFEMLNDEQITGVRQVIATAGGTPLAYSLRPRSAHPRLAADSATLYRLAEDLGEEIRLAQMARRICLELADKAGMQSNLMLQVHPVECEDIDLLVDEWLELAERFRHLALVCELPLGAFARGEDVSDIKSHLTRRDIEICGLASGLEISDLSLFRSHLDYLRMSATQGTATISEAARVIGSATRIIVDQVDDKAQIESLTEAGASLFQGSAIGSTVPISKEA